MTNLSQLTLQERLAIDSEKKVKLVQDALGHPLADDVARRIAEPASDPLGFIMWLAQVQPTPDQQARSEQFFHDRARTTQRGRRPAR
jgi:hypothetical protein